ncbi:hypothetical protein [Kribbia dieselivorans]|uniref:hypothetical protein n=1 Tax=Kribbia dieselivorans TaxID=331526 RepID=UPI00083878BF|nr:hypothetical protein [Kribbia dieselivorans]
MLTNLLATRTIVGLLLSAIIGGGAAAVAGVSLVASQSPNDASAITTGPADTVPANELLGYGE